MRLGLARPVKGTFKAIVLFAFFVLICTLLFAAAKKLQPAFILYAESYANNAVNEIVNDAVQKVYESGDYASLSRVTEAGTVNTLETDTAKINKLRADITQSIQNGITERDADIIYVPLGSVTDFYLFAGLGPKIPVRVYPVSILKTDFRDEFESAGINQVKHRIYLDVSVKMSFAGIAFSEEETITASALITETVIVGNTPAYYGGSMSAAMPQKGTDINE